MTLLDYLKRYGFTVLTLMVFIVAGAVLWRLYDRIYAPLFLRSMVDSSPDTPDGAPAAVILKAMEHIDTKKSTTVDFSTVPGQLTLPPEADREDAETATTEGIIIEGAAP